MRNKAKLAVLLGLALMAAYPMEASANQYTVRDGEREHYEETLRKDIIRANPSKLTDDPNVTPRYIKPICDFSSDTFEFGYGGINIGSKNSSFHATYWGSNSTAYQKQDYYPELYMYNAAIANSLAHEMGHWYGNTNDYNMEEEDRADNYAMEFTEPLEYGSYAGQWAVYNSGLGKGKNHKERFEDAQDALDYIEKASNGRIKFLGSGRGSFVTFQIDGKFFLRENATLYGEQYLDQVYPAVPKDSDHWDDFVVDENMKRNGIREAYNPNSDYHLAYVAAQMAFAIKYNVFDVKHTHLIDAWTFWHNGEAVTAENQQHHDTLSKWTVLYFDNPVSGGRKIVDIYPYTTDELSDHVNRFDALLKTAPPSGDGYIKWCKENSDALKNDPAISFLYIYYSIPDV